MVAPSLPKLTTATTLHYGEVEKEQEKTKCFAKTGVQEDVSVAQEDILYMERKVVFDSLTTLMPYTCVLIYMACAQKRE